MRILHFFLSFKKLQSKICHAESNFERETKKAKRNFNIQSSSYVLGLLCYSSIAGIFCDCKRENSHLEYDDGQGKKKKEEDREENIF